MNFVPMRPSNAAKATARVADVTAQDTWVTGDVVVNGAGEALVDIDFPVKFGERPMPILGGGEFLTEILPEPGNFPTADAIVVGWIMEGSYYVGVRLGVVTSGRSNQFIRVSFAFMGLGLTNIATDKTSTE